MEYDTCIILICKPKAYAEFFGWAVIALRRCDVQPPSCIYLPFLWLLLHAKRL